MTIRILQTCNHCGEERELNVGYYGGRDSVAQAASVGGWLEGPGFKHLCGVCIKKMIVT